MKTSVLDRSPIEIKDLESLASLADEIACELRGQRYLLLLEGEMGAGKTQFTKFLTQSLGGVDTVSPSFSIHNEYETSSGLLNHFDLFRLENADDLESTGFWDVFEHDSGFIVIEWSERLSEFGLAQMIPRAWPQLRLKFEIINSSVRRVTLRNG